MWALRFLMPLRALIIPDKFKGTLTAQAAAEAIARGWGKTRPADILHLLPMSDGGDGFGEVISSLLQAKRQTVRTMDAAHRPCRSIWWWEPSSARRCLIGLGGSATCDAGFGVAALWVGSFSTPMAAPLSGGQASTG